jgi:hypothetical protein
MAPLDLTVDDQRVYWTDTGAGTISSVPLSGGSVVTIASGQSKPLRVAVDATHAYWANNLGGAIMRAPKDGQGAPEVVVAITSPEIFALAGDYVYVATSNHVDRVLKTGGTFSTFSTVMGAQNDTLTFTEIAADDTAIYGITNRALGGPVLWRIQLSDGTSHQLPFGITMMTPPLPLRLDATNVYFENGYNLHHVVGLEKTQGSSQVQIDPALPTNMYIGTTDWFDAFAPTECGIVWSHGNVIVHQRPQQRTAALLTSGPIARTTYANGYVYWTATDGTLNRLALP